MDEDQEIWLFIAVSDGERDCFLEGINMYQDVYVRGYERIWWYECGDVAENQQTGERYFWLEEPLCHGR